MDTPNFWNVAAPLAPAALIPPADYCRSASRNGSYPHRPFCHHYHNSVYLPTHFHYLRQTHAARKFATRRFMHGYFDHAVPALFRTRKRVPNGHERCSCPSCCCWWCCYHICDLLRLFHFITDRRKTSHTHRWKHYPHSHCVRFSR